MDDNSLLPKRKMVVLTPVKNEAWILPIFLNSTSIWADYIIIADQNSTDGTRDIASHFPKVILINNNSSDLDEGYRDRILIEKARETVGSNGILFRIDADEIFTPNFDSEEWNKIKQSKPGSVWHYRWIQLNKDLCSYWETSTMYGAFVDDGRDYSPHGLIHSRAMFNPNSSNQFFVTKDIALLHFQFADWKRMCSKHIWYQCFERINYSEKSAVDIYRMYHWMYNSSLPFKAIPSEWIDVYNTNYGIDLNAYKREKHYWWDEKVREYFSEYSPRHFRHIETYLNLRELLFAEGKNVWDKLLLLYLHCTKNRYNIKRGYIYKLILKTDSYLKRRMHI